MVLVVGEVAGVETERGELDESLRGGKGGSAFAPGNTDVDVVGAERMVRADVDVREAPCLVKG